MLLSNQLWRLLTVEFLNLQTEGGLSGGFRVEMINSVAPSFKSQLVLRLDVTHSSV